MQREDNIKQPDSESTSKDTVADVTESEAETGSDKSHAAPSPDGAFNESNDRDKAGPM